MHRACLLQCHTTKRERKRESSFCDNDASVYDTYKIMRAVCVFTVVGLETKTTTQNTNGPSIRNLLLVAATAIPRGLASRLSTP